MPFLAAAAPYIALGTAAVGAYAQTQAGEAAQNNAKVVAIQQERDANAAQVEAQQAATAERKKARYLRSRALAVAGASGAGVSDPTVSQILTGIDTEGEMNALNALWSGDETARALRHGARATRNEGSARRGAYYGQAGATALQGLTSFAGENPTFFSKYGGDRAAAGSYGMSGGGAAGPEMRNFARLTDDESY